MILSENKRTDAMIQYFSTISNPTMDGFNEMYPELAFTSKGSWASYKTYMTRQLHKETEPDGFVMTDGGIYRLDSNDVFFDIRRQQQTHMAKYRCFDIYSFEGDIPYKNAKQELEAQVDSILDSALDKLTREGNTLYRYAMCAGVSDMDSNKKKNTEFPYDNGMAPIFPGSALTIQVGMQDEYEGGWRYVFEVDNFSHFAKGYFDYYGMREGTLDENDDRYLAITRALTVDGKMIYDSRATCITADGLLWRPAAIIIDVVNDI